MDEAQTIDLSVMIRDLDTQLARAEAQLLTLRLTIARLRGERAGILKVIQAVNERPVVSSGRG